LGCAQPIKSSTDSRAISAGIRSWRTVHRPSDWFHFRSARGAFRRRLFQRGYGLAPRRNLSLSRISPRIGSLPPHPFQAGPADQQRDNAGQHGQAPKR
jgi:hypothetical protein